MTYEEFKEKITNAGIAVPSDEKFQETWTVGGDRGYDWRGNEYGQFDAEPEPSYWVLDDVLAAVCPEISFLTYKRLCVECVSYTGTQRDDFYGVHEHLMTKQFYLKELFDFLANVTPITGRKK